MARFTKNSDRDYDVVLLGATGFTGRFAAMHLAEIDRDLKWAIAGRSGAKLTKLAEELRLKTSQNPDVIPVEFTTQSLDALAMQTRCLVATVGPFPQHGVLVFKSCAENGTHYVDINGETPSVLELIKAYEDTAKSTGAMMIPSCGVGSLPADLLTCLMVEKVKETFDCPTSAGLISVHDSRVQASGGTLNGLVTSVSSYGLRNILKAGKPWALSPIRPARPQADESRNVSKDIIERLKLGTLGFGMTGTHDQAIVQRTWGLLQQAEHSGLTSTSYGPNFDFRSVQQYPSVVHGWAFWLLVWVMTIFPAILPPVKWLIKLLVPPGSGPSEQERQKNFIEYRGVAIADLKEDAQDFQGNPLLQRGVQARLRYNGDSYVFSGMMAVEAAMILLDSGEDCVAHKLGGGILTPATLGQPLADRLRTAGVQIEVEAL
ncbi:hypothetical protein CGMCC3_g10186 [Colletotrichum fructicola]|uniref:Putative trans-acting enoyl reductase n=1 Tax=Colletotrichum fructicola (strain Nara gc5) TaxID=1213859 RepID=A0A7J6IJV3_COLFN|nr:uncharacterized protein CGMCC3_g10186 [Colletotrichum fructicola]KAE9573764.1 hypothetical protein CGMCC3_g10186 [Colletotrichum fructicola]KAF4476918.1 putative trans-acting enoyl reductase [Colletotrichum fructicola Nara gc5]KAF4889644.1 putative trans-acting enoyl reductase [Colletotrichum fructicola]